ncbi:MAG: hypothetical protein ACOYMW_09220 [Candidatus Competibacteraceae bacterium]
MLTEVDAEQANLLENLHRLCDWVIAADRNAGLEYFDSPRDLPLVYDAYLIDCVPERDDLGFLQLITSTSSFDEVRHLLDGALNEMGLSASQRNCEFLLNALRAVSGRLALRLAGLGHTPQEMIAVALVHRHCAQASEADAKLMAKNFAVADKVALYADRMKQMPKYRGMYYGEGLRMPLNVSLLAEAP